MADGDGDDAETLAERLAWARGGELVSTLEELEALAAAYPGPTGDAALGALVDVLAGHEEHEPEAVQQAAEVVARLVDGRSADGRRNGAGFLKEPRHVVVLLDVLETSDAYTAVVVLELIASLHGSHGEALVGALLGAPAGGARLLETLGDAREPVRNASTALLERLTRPGDAPSGPADELRTCCAFSEVFPRLWARLEEAPGGAAGRDCLRLAANVLAGPAVCLALFGDAAPAGGLGALPRYLEILADDDEAAEARKTALAALDVARRYVGAPGSDRPARQSGAWAFEDLRLSLVALAFTDDAGGAVALDGDAAYDDGLVVDPSSDAWWSAATAEDAAARRDDVRAGALDVLARLLDDHEANGLAMCEARVPTDGARSPLAPKFVLEVATRPRLFGPAAAAARDVARVMWATEGAAIVAVMHAVAPPPSDDGDAEAPDESAVGALAAALRSPDRSATALSLFRGLLGKNVSVRELALRAPSATGSPLFEDVFRDHVAADGAAVADGLALLCARRRPQKFERDFERNPESAFGRTVAPPASRERL